ncbi:MAG: helix-turn-helix domain-containing protein, partial [Bacteroidales bacterium]|nr:helix-turn-helix domain-containing protein [Bacteroidales bacterium]
MPSDYPNVRKNSIGKIPSPSLTLELYRKGMSVEEMMETRKLAQATVEGHLLKFIATGEVARSFFIDDEQAELVIKLLDLGETTGAIFSAMEGNLTYNQIRAVKLLWETTKE